MYSFSPRLFRARKIRNVLEGRQGAGARLAQPEGRLDHHADAVLELRGVVVGDARDAVNVGVDVQHELAHGAGRPANLTV